MPGPASPRPRRRRNTRPRRKRWRWRLGVRRLGLAQQQVAPAAPAARRRATCARHDGASGHPNGWLVSLAVWHGPSVVVPVESLPPSAFKCPGPASAPSGLAVLVMLPRRRSGPGLSHGCSVTVALVGRRRRLTIGSRHRLRAAPVALPPSTTRPHGTSTRPHRPAPAVWVPCGACVCLDMAGPGSASYRCSATVFCRR